MSIIFDEDKQNRKLDELRHKEEEDLVQILSSRYGVDYVNLLGTSVNTDALRLIPENTARAAQAAAYSIMDKKVKIAARNPNDEKIKNIVSEISAKGYQVETLITSTQSLDKAWSAYKDLSFAYETKSGSIEISSEEISNIIKDAKSLPLVTEVLQKTLAAKKSYRISRILETIIAGGLATDASDVHFEPEETHVRLRYRLDGVLQDLITIDNETYALILSRVKLISGMKLNIKKDSQDGRFNIRLSIGDIEVRVSVIPSAYNESIVMRLLNPKSINVPLEDLGIPSNLMTIITRAISKPDGMILTTGPTGSGKTTTLYAFLKKVHTPDVKIITLEDPIEYHLPGIVQTQVNEKGYDFLEGLRATVRQDPDIIMIGEIRDGETANIAINSALTGHLVFSTLHTNDAAGTFPRLIELGINPKIIPSSLRISIAQRLLRKLCPDCKKEVPVEGEAKIKIQENLDAIVDKSLLPPSSDKMWISVGCAKCNQTGYKGRIGIFEAIIMDPEIEKAVENNSSDREIWEIAKKQGILTLKQDGVLKILKGVTSFDELERVISIRD